ncbi:hypothetical protein CMI37_02225 [Candidatus Pacearchaeota archaeon]|nr:hypothetical protein [Candidatus Pacearchaeota archaeon]|tara:strand:+ start:4129 stop:4476 length:348 start_codon:yes stop_codon:yes gene_type:complete
MSFVYLASPYSGTEEQMEERFHLAVEHTAWMLDRSVTVYSPIVHCHHVRSYLPRDLDFWLYHDFNMIRASHELRILKLDGWRKSEGIAREIDYCREIKRSITTVEFKSSSVSPLS